MLGTASDLVVCSANSAAQTRALWLHAAVAVADAPVCSPPPVCEGTPQIPAAAGQFGPAKKEHTESAEYT